MKLEGEKIILRPPRASDAESIYTYAKDREVSRYMTVRFPYPYKRKDAEGFIKRVAKEWQEKNQKNTIFVIEHLGSKQVVGTIGLKKIDTYNKNAELGYWVAKKYWRQGIASEAVKLILDYGFNELNLKRVYAGVFHPNTASQKLLEKIGFKHEGTLRKSARRSEQWFDRLWFGLLKEEYKLNNY